MMSRRGLVLGLVLAALGTMKTAQAQIEVRQEPLRLTLEGYANLTGGCDAGVTAPARAADCGGRRDGAARFIGLAATGGGWSIGPRVIVQTTTENAAAVGERSLLVLGPWGRLEVGRRQGLPDVLIGYAPNNFTFTAAEFGPATGPGLDPDGQLPTTFIKDSVMAQVNRLSVLGFAARYYGDQSPKAIYVPPHRAGVQAGVSFAPDMDDRTGPFGALLQTGVSYERYGRDDVYRMGVTYTYAEGAAGTVTNLHSLSAGAVVTFHERLILAASATYEGASGLPAARGAHDVAHAFGYSASANYNLGPWTVGAYYQRAQEEGDPRRAGADRLRVIQAGVSYRLSPRWRFYGAAYRFQFDDEGAAREASRGTVLLLGTRVTL